MIVKPANRTNTVHEYYFSKKLAQIDMMKKKGADIINLGIGSPDKPPSQDTLNALADESARPSSHGYQSYRGIVDLRAAFSRWYMKYFKVSLDPDNEILPLLGSKEGIMHISMAFVNEGDEVLIPDPGYPTYSSVTRLVGGIVRKYDLKEDNGWLPDLTAIEKSDLSRVRLMWVNYPHMPTGAKGSVSLFKDLVHFAREKSILLCNDNPYSFILNDDYQSLLSVNGAREISLELNSLSKSHNMPGWRVGMVAGHREYIKNILKVKSNVDSGMFLPVQMAAIKALDSPDTWYESINTNYRKRRKIVEEMMDILECRYEKSQAGLFVWGRIPDRIDDCETFVEKILEISHVFITPGFIFGHNGKRYIRISLCTEEERLLEARKRIAGFMKND